MIDLKKEVMTNDLVEVPDSELEVRPLAGQRSKVLKDWRNDDGKY